ncbi:MAG TPA: hypothetical protein VFV54_11415 [Thermoanaerobaculia bacterium]|nr:hypothetical protein [Thermoanaerobaculia bacterium]
MSSAGESSITVTSEGCEGAASFLWSEVRAVSVANRPGEEDDILALRFALRDGRTMEVREDVAGFTQLVQVLPEVFPGFPDHNEWLYEAAETEPGSEMLLFEQ